MRLPLRRELHTTDRPSSTAQWTALGRAFELRRPDRDRIVTDAYAPVFLSRTSERVLRSLEAAEPAVRLAERLPAVALATSGLCRHRFIDDQLLAALPEVEQVLILGAGYDSRAYRFRKAIGDRPVFEVDLAPLSRRKAGIVAAASDVFGATSIRRVEIDFRTQSLAGQLAGSGFRQGARTFVAWEGVSMYLTRDTVAATLLTLAEICGAESVLAMDCWQHVGGRGPYDAARRVGERAIRLIGEPIGFGVRPAGITALLDDAGFEVADLANAREMGARYATAGRTCDEGMYVLAAHLR